MKKLSFLFLGFILLFPLACKGNQQKDPQILAKIAELNQELLSTKSAIEDAKKKDSEYSGGLIKALIGVRIQLLQTNEALIQQRIHALEAGAPIKIELYGTTPDEQRAASLDQEIQAKRIELAAEKKDMERYSGGLVLAMKASAAATLENTIAMLEQERMIAKYGLSSKTAIPKVDKPLTVQAPPQQKTTFAADEIVSAKITNKRTLKAEYSENVWFDIEWTPLKLKKPARSIKGIIDFCDLFGEVHFSIGKTISIPMKTEESLTEKGVGFEYNQFKKEHIWMRQTDLKDMTFKFRVTNILYEDGEREDY